MLNRLSGWIAGGTLFPVGLTPRGQARIHCAETAKAPRSDGKPVQGRHIFLTDCAAWKDTHSRDTDEAKSVVCLTVTPTSRSGVRANCLWLCSLAATNATLGTRAAPIATEAGVESGRSLPIWVGLVTRRALGKRVGRSAGMRTPAAWQVTRSSTDCADEKRSAAVALPGADRTGHSFMADGPQP